MAGQANFFGLDIADEKNNPLAGNDPTDANFPQGNISFSVETTTAVEEGKQGAPATSFVGGVIAGGLMITGEGVHFILGKEQFKKHRC